MPSPVEETRELQNERRRHRGASLYQWHVTRSRLTRRAQWRTAMMLPVSGRVEGPFLMSSFFFSTWSAAFVEHLESLP